MDDIAKWGEQDLIFWLEDDGAPWHNKGTPIKVPPKDGEEAARVVNLAWEVQVCPLFYKWKGPDGSEILMPTESNAVVREDGAWLSTVGPDFTPLQNLEAFRFFHRALGPEVVYRVAGAIGGPGRVIWILASLPEFFTVGKDDPVAEFLLLSNCHGMGFSGRQAVRILVTPIRVVCRNTLEAAFMQTEKLEEGSKIEVVKRIYHSKDVADQVIKYADMLASIRRIYEETKESFNVLAAHPVTSQDVQEFFDALFPVLGKKRPQRMQSIRNNVMDLFEAPLTQASTNTAWGLYNAVAAYVDHRRGKSDSRLYSAWFGGGSDLKNEALKLSMRLASGLPILPDHMLQERLQGEDL